MKKFLESNIMSYLTYRSTIQKLADLIMILLLFTGYGIITGRIKFDRPHDVATVFKASNKVETALISNPHSVGDTFIARFVFHNGQSSLNGKFNFLKWSMTEYVAYMPYVKINRSDWINLPLLLDVKMIANFVDNKCYSKVISLRDPMYLLYAGLNTGSITACPIMDDSGNLFGFILSGNISPVPPSVDAIEALAHSRTVL